MKKFIRYLYEYQNGRRVQNVGFVKVEESDDSVVIQIYGRGFPTAGNQVMEIFLFYMTGNQCVGISMGQVQGMRPMFGYRLEYTAEDVGGEDIFRNIDGIILLSDVNGYRRWYGAVWDERPVNIEQMIPREEMIPERTNEVRPEVNPERLDEARPEANPERMNEARPEVNPEQTNEARPEANTERTNEMRPGMNPEQTNEARPEMNPEQENIVQPETRPAPTSPGARQIGSAQEQIPALASPENMRVESSQNHTAKNQMQLHKIVRQDLAKLPRRDWRLANNNFLLHGYHNYHHLVSFRKDGKCWLGVPGIYHPREQRAASAFGFGQFMRPEEGEIELDENEMNSTEDFGYWCRVVGAVVEN